MATATEVATRFGYSVVFFNSSPELKKLLSTAVAQNWTTDKFVAKFRATKWYRSHGEAFREITVLRTTDPATYRQRVATTYQRVLAMAYQLGAHMPSGSTTGLAQTALLNGWSDDQLKQAMAKYINAGPKGNFVGGAAQIQSQLQALAGEYGYRPSTATMGSWVVQIARGANTVEGIQQAIIATTASKFPALKQRLMEGETLADIAEPYIDSYSRILEINPKTISLDNTTLMKALAAKDAKGAPTTQTIWQFEQDLRQDKRWLSTKNAQDSLMGQTHQVLQNLGFSAI